MNMIQTLVYATLKDIYWNYFINLVIKCLIIVNVKRIINKITC